MTESRPKRPGLTIAVEKTPGPVVGESAIDVAPTPGPRITEDGTKPGFDVGRTPGPGFDSDVATAIVPETRPLRRPQRWTLQDAVVALAFAAIAAAMFLPTIDFDFVRYDDHRVVLGQPQLFDTPDFATGLKAILTELPREEPLLVRDITWLIDARLFGFGNARGHHIGNVALHALVMALVFGLYRRLGFAFAPAAVAGAIFLVHPVHVEPVAWVMGRKDLLSTAFALAAIIAFIGYLRLSEPGAMRPFRATVAYGASVVFVALGILSKVNLVVMPMLLAAAVLWVGPKTGRWRRLLRIVPHAAIVAGGFAWYQYVVTRYGLLGRGPSLTSTPYLEQMVDFLPAQIVAHVANFLIPWDYGIFYDVPSIGIANPPAVMWLGWASVASVLITLAIAHRRAPTVAFCLAGATLALVPYLNLVYIGIVAGNRYLYFASVFLCPLIGLGIVAAWRHRFARAVMLGLGIGWLAIAGYQHVRWLSAWKDNAALWTYEIQRERPSLLAWQAHARELVVRAEKSSGGAPQRELLDRAWSAVESGLAAFDDLNVEPVPGFYNYQTLYRSKLLHWRGRILAARGAPLEQTEAAFADSHTAAPHRLSSYSLALVRVRRALVEAPDAERARLAMTAIGDYVDRIQATEDKMRSRTLLDPNLAIRYPDLAPRMAELRQRIDNAPLRGPTPEAPQSATYPSKRPPPPL